MNIPQMTPPQAHDAMQKSPQAIYLDVRTEGEFDTGHPTGARNIPIMMMDPATRQPAANPDFLAAAERHIPKTAKVLCGCASGVRSQRAAEVLAQAGYGDVSNVQGGFVGSHEATGWADAGLPVERGQTPGACWADLKTKK